MLERLFGWLRPKETRPGPTSDYWYTPALEPASSGATVTTETAMAVSAFFACVRVLSQTMCSLPLLMYRRLPDGGKERANSHPLYEVLHDTPNTWQTAAEWRQIGMVSLILRGNFYCQIVPGMRGSNHYLLPLPPDRVTVDQLTDGRLRYKYRPADGPPIIYNQEQVLHIRGLSLDGVTGVSVLTYARHALGLAMAQETHGAKLFGNGSLPSFALETPERMNEQAVGNFRAAWRGLHAGAQNAHNPPILQGGMKIHELSLTNEDSQWLESRKFEAEELCRFTGVPPHMIGLLDRATFSNIEHQGIEFVRYTVRPWCTLWQQCIWRDLIQEPEFFAEFLLDDLQRGDTPSRYGAYNIGIQSGFLTRNEVRTWENLNPMEGGDELLEPLNMQKAGQDKPPDEPPPQPPPPPEPPDDADEIRARKRRRKRRREPDADQVRTQEAFRTLVRDAANRIASHEVRGLSVRADKADQNRKRWLTWADKFYQDHGDYAMKTLTPILTSWAIATQQDVDGAAAVTQLCAEARTTLAAAPSIPELLADWTETRCEAVSERLESIIFRSSSDAI